MKHFLLMLSLGLAACSSANMTSPVSKMDQVELIDRRAQLSPFSDAIVGGRGSFLDVKSHKARYEFSCPNNDYTINFFIEPKPQSEKKTQILNITAGDILLDDAKLRQINDGLSRIHLVGPVGLRCSLDTEDSSVHLTIYSATENPNSLKYEFANLTFLLSDSDFN